VPILVDLVARFARHAGGGARVIGITARVQDGPRGIDHQAVASGVAPGLQGGDRAAVRTQSIVESLDGLRQLLLKASDS
jgi:hypothetical protein